MRILCESDHHHHRRKRCVRSESGCRVGMPVESGRATYRTKALADARPNGWCGFQVRLSLAVSDISGRMDKEFGIDVVDSDRFSPVDDYYDTNRILGRFCDIKTQKKSRRSS